MTSEIKKALKKVDTKDWRKVSVEFGPHSIEVALPPNFVELTMKEVPVLSNPQKAI